MLNVIYIFIGFLFIFSYPNSLSPLEDQCYLLLLFSYFLVVGHVCFLNYKKKMDLFEPFSIVAICSILLFNIAPLIFIITGYTSLGGVYMMNGCIYGTIIYTMSYFMFSLGYYAKSYEYPTVRKFNFMISDIERRGMLRRALFAWCFCFLCAILYQIFGRGLSLSYIFSLATTSVDTVEVADTPLKFLLAFASGIIVCLLYIVELSKNRTLIIILVSLTIIMFIINGTRVRFVFLFGSFAVYYYLKNRKRPSVNIVILSISLFVVFSSWLGANRTNIRGGQGVGPNNEFIFVEAFSKNFNSNTNIVLPYYCIVDGMPDKFQYRWGNGYFLEPIVHFIPRALFPSKPAPEDADIIVAMNKTTGYDIAGKYGMATPFISEAYIQFSLFGVLIVMLILGVLLRKSKELYLNNVNNIHKLIIYSFIYISLFQLINRGYMASNVDMYIFSLLPILYINYKSR